MDRQTDTTENITYTHSRVVKTQSQGFKAHLSSMACLSHPPIIVPPITAVNTSLTDKITWPYTRLYPYSSPMRGLQSPLILVTWLERSSQCNIRVVWVGVKNVSLFSWVPAQSICHYELCYEKGLEPCSPFWCQQYRQSNVRCAKNKVLPSKKQYSGDWNWDRLNE